MLKCPGETTQQPSILGEIFLLLEDQLSHDFLWDELSLIHEDLGQHTNFSVHEHVVSEQVPAGELLQLEVSDNAQRQGGLAQARGSHDHCTQELPTRPHGC